MNVKLRGRAGTSKSHFRVKDLTRTATNEKSVAHLCHSLETGAYRADPSESPPVPELSTRTLPATPPQRLS